MRILIGAAMAAALVSGCAAAPAPAGTQLAAADQKVCKSQTMVGSILPKRVCASQAQWDAYDDRGAQSVDAFKDATRDQGTPNNGGDWTMPGTPN